MLTSIRLINLHVHSIHLKPHFNELHVSSIHTLETEDTLSKSKVKDKTNHVQPCQDHKVCFAFLVRKLSTKKQKTLLVFKDCTPQPLSGADQRRGVPKDEHRALVQQ